MNRITRMLTVSGLGLVAAATLGAGPAMAATGSSSAGVAPQASQGTTQHWYDDDDDSRVVGYYRSLRRCIIAGRIGERFDRWDDSECVRVGYGFHRRYALVVEFDDNDWDNDWYNWDDDDYNDNGPWWFHKYHKH
ncbi:hypothetical protein Ade02nite_53080 [Paractinoplanes deccanensis]|uniref:Uncharacterized protein n=1 Tax=Paractinoplanes deccanensis TaxID=113561 RepID=A0ABQ3Y9I6_9ACTN|nr:hypothetical protein [Actinoplanes deccanensis]GID76667.1 hypothetical protein Ade02nite_53080 [Actinoplanes deccanensis]